MEEQHQQRHWKYTHHVLDKLEKHNLYLKPEKCKFKKKEIEYLGVIIGQSKIQMDSGKLKGIVDWLVPRNPTEVQQFLGFTGYYQYFVPNYSKIIQPLLNLTKKNLLWHWDQPQHDTFEELKTRMCCSLVLTQPNFKEKFYLQTDASAYSMGTILSQKRKNSPSL
jgi:hypothetical protein